MSTKLALLVLGAALTGCVAYPAPYARGYSDQRYYDNGAGDSYSYTRHRHRHRHFGAPRDDGGHYRERYYGSSAEPSNYAETAPCPPGLNGGHLIGGVVGGVLGNQVGRGGGRAAATAAGAALGAVAGGHLARPPGCR